MPITSYIPSSAIAKPGVCTSSTRPASPYDGQVIYETDTDRTLVWNGSGWVFLSTSSAGDVGLVKIVPTSATNATISANGDIAVGSTVSSITVSGVFSSLFDNYKIIFNGGTGSVSSQIRFQLSGISTGYYGAFAGTVYTTSAFSGQNDNNATLCNYVGYATTTMAFSTIDIYSPFTATQKTLVASNVYLHSSAAYGNYVAQITGTTSSTGFILSPSSGTLTSGTIRVYGYRN